MVWTVAVFGVSEDVLVVGAKRLKASSSSEPSSCCAASFG